MNKTHEEKLIKLVEELVEVAEKSGIGGYSLESEYTILYSKIMYLLGYVEALREDS